MLPFASILRVFIFSCMAFKINESYMINFVFTIINSLHFANYYAIIHDNDKLTILSFMASCFIFMHQIAILDRNDAVFRIYSYFKDF